MGLSQKFLVACGGHGRVLLDAFIQSHVKINGIIDPCLERNSIVFNVPVIGDDSILSEYNSEEVYLVNGFGCKKNTDLRREKFENWRSKKFSILGVVHPSAIVSSSARISETAQVMAGAIVQNQSRIEDNVVINTGSSIDHDCIISKHAFISPGVTICGGVQIGEGVFVGAGAVILPYLKIGDRSVIGAGSIVTKDIQTGVTVIGNPAKRIRG